MSALCQMGEGSNCLPYVVEMLVVTCRRLLCTQNIVKAFKVSAKAPVGDLLD